VSLEAFVGDIGLGDFRQIALWQVARTCAIPLIRRFRRGELRQVNRFRRGELRQVFSTLGG
jgi:hypothetical protein